MTTLSPDFWGQRFKNAHTPWDRGGCSPQLQRWLDQSLLSPGRIAVPGCGRGWEVVALAQRGFEVVAIDYTEAAVAETQKLLSQAGLTAEVVLADVLTYQPKIPFDAIYEQTCLCALHPDHWFDYSQQLSRWLKPDGQLFALFMQALKPGAAEGFIQGPPFHCDIHAMRALFNAQQWQWPTTPFEAVSHPNGWHELAVCLRKIGAA